MHRVNIIRALNEAIREEMSRDSRVVLLGEDVGVGVFGTSKGLLEQFGPDRIRNTPISEGTVVGTAVGAAMTGLRPVVDLMYMTFSYMAMDGLINQAAKFPYMTGGQVFVPLTVVGISGGGHAGAAQHSENPYGMFMGVPGLKVVVPSDPYTAKGLMKAAIRDENPVLVFHESQLNRLRMEIPDEDYICPLGKARVVRKGDDVTVIAIGHITQKALNAAKILDQSGISVEVVDTLTLAPLDIETLTASVKKTTRLMVCDDTPEYGGASSGILGAILPEIWSDLDTVPIILGRHAVPMPFNRSLEDQVTLSVECMVANLIKLVEGGG